MVLLSLLFACATDPLDVDGLALGLSAGRARSIAPGLHEDGNSAHERLVGPVPSGGTATLDFSWGTLDVVEVVYPEDVGFDDVLDPLRARNGPPDGQLSAGGAALASWSRRGDELMVAGHDGGVTVRLARTESKALPLVVGSAASLQVGAFALMAVSFGRLRRFLDVTPEYAVEADLERLRGLASFVMRAVLATHACLIGSGLIFAYGLSTGLLAGGSFLLLVALGGLALAVSIAGSLLERKVWSLPAAPGLVAERDRVAHVWRSKPLPDW